MPSALALIFALLALTALAAVVAERLHVPSAIVLVLLGFVVALVPGLPGVTLDPELVLLALLPPLLYASGVGMSWRSFRVSLRPILLLAIGCVLFTALAVAALAHLAFGLPWAVGFLLGAVVSPPDAVAPMAIARRLAVPQRVLVVLEGESLVNDATALILFGFALTAVSTGEFSMTRAVGTFALVVVGEVAWGIGVAAAMLRLRRAAHSSQVEIVLALLTPFVSFWLPHGVGGSGVIATVAAGLYVSANGRRFIGSATRLQGFFVWDLVVFVVTGVVFVLTGLQARTVTSGLGIEDIKSLLIAGVAVSLVVVLVRYVWVFPATYLPRWLFRSVRERDPVPSWRYPLVIGYTGIRGVVSLAAALSIPVVLHGKAFPGRQFVLVATYCVIVLTLLGQGLSLPWLIRRVGLDDDGRREDEALKRSEIEARIVGVDAALSRIDALEKAGAPALLIASLRRRQSDRRSLLAATLDPSTPGSPTADEARLQLQVIDAERQQTAQSYADGDVDDESRRRIERELDLEEARARHSEQSASGGESGRARTQRPRVF